MDELRFNVEVLEPPEERVTLEVLSEAVRLPDDEVELPVVPTSMFTVDGLAVKEKSGTFTVTVAV